MITISKHIVELIHEYKTEDIRLDVLSSLVELEPNKQKEIPFEGIKIGHLLNMVSASNPVFVADNTIKSIKTQTENLNQSIKEIGLLVYVISPENNSLECKVSVNPDPNDFKYFYEIDETLILCSVVKITFQDDTIGWTLIGPVEPRNVERIERRMLENELGYDFT